MKVGDYVRTKYGISKIENISPNDYNKEHDYVELETFVFDGLDAQGFFTTDEIIKSSPNIIDLIEEGDYVNGLKVSRVDGTYHGRKDKAIYCDYCENKETGKWTMIYDDEIKSIVTKEQFESMEYKVVE